MRYSIKEKATKVYKKAVVKHHNPKTNKVTKAEIEAKPQDGQSSELQINSEHISSQDELVIHARVENLQQAEEKARAALHQANSKHQEGSITVPGNPLLVAGNNFDLTGMGALSGKYQIIRSMHRIGRDGYTTDLDIKRIGEVTNLGTKFTSSGEVLFDFDQAVIKPAGYVEIERILAFMVANPESVIEVGGHTDNVASAEYNQSLSERRANAVRDYMIGKGILATRLVAKGYGEIKPVASNATPEGRQKNRRTEFIVIRNI
jgi:outer membrane protein OmpA-like peptidoglycan-associated protein